MPKAWIALLWVAAGAAGVGCATRSGSLDPSPFPARLTASNRSPVVGPLKIRIQYPPRTADSSVVEGAAKVLRPDSEYVIASRDSAFLFGSVGRGDARLTVNGLEVDVHSTGGWLAWLRIPDDTVARFDLVATAGNDTDRVTLVSPIRARFHPPAHGAWIDTCSMSPTGDVWLRAGEGVRLDVEAAPEASVRALLPDGRAITLLPEKTHRRVPWGERAFGTTPEQYLRSHVTRYATWWVGPLGPDPGYVLRPHLAPPLEDSDWVWLEAAKNGDTTRVRWPLRVGLVDSDSPPVATMVEESVADGARTGSVPGRPTPWGTYNWFFPTGTVAAVSGRQGEQVRLQLSRTSVAWVDANHAQPLEIGTPPPYGKTGSMRLTPHEKSVLLRVPLPAPVPFRVDETESSVLLNLYGVAADMDWIQYGEPDPLVKLITFEQRTEDEIVIAVDLSEPVWGYRTRWSGSDLLLEIRRPPPIDAQKPFSGVRIAVDPGHPPGGATGPTGVKEHEVTLAVGLKLTAILEEAGAEVVMLRSDDEPLSLYERVLAAEQADAHVLVSIHANALPDGVNPFVNNGTSVYYFHPRSAPLARELDRALVEEFGYRDLGIGRADLALVRPTWMPAALTEGLFLMIPDQEAVLSSAEGQFRYARGIARGISNFLRMRAHLR